ncbi:hypothetical protein NP233_g12923 [Leucocoprinus birnbaumii]|uniref:Protein kinase domain-containing protein n=1 Tax=Leucocoprinus birnbaumii TaxID=56174 RepID=A0AAD5VDV4_9AGAR|nr:hypothetical protein NP233_g12923 [Leucocoprinus birnbaumii]
MRSTHAKSSLFSRGPTSAKQTKDLSLFSLKVHRVQRGGNVYLIHQNSKLQRKDLTSALKGAEFDFVGSPGDTCEGAFRLPSHSRPEESELIPETVNLQRSPTVNSMNDQQPAPKSFYPLLGFVLSDTDNFNDFVSWTGIFRQLFHGHSREAIRWIETDHFRRDYGQIIDVERVDDPRSIRDEDLVIVIMGPTGSGKSTAINSDSNSLMSALRVKFGDKINVVLVDTPGFDDTSRSDLEILETIADWFKAVPDGRGKISGIVYLHRITDPRMMHTVVKNFDMFQRLCGERFFEKVVLATAMWPEDLGPVSASSSLTAQLSPDLISREKDLIEIYWGLMIERGSQYFRFTRTRESAWSIFNSLLRIQHENRLIHLVHIQEELVNQKRSVPRTTAGKRLHGFVQEVALRQTKVIEQLKAELLKSGGQDRMVIDSLLEDLSRLQEEKKRTKWEMDALDPSVFKRFTRLFTPNRRHSYSSETNHRGEANGEPHNLAHRTRHENRPQSLIKDDKRQSTLSAIEKSPTSQPLPDVRGRGSDNYPTDSTRNSDSAFKSFPGIAYDDVNHQRSLQPPDSSPSPSEEPLTISDCSGTHPLLSSIASENKHLGVSSGSDPTSLECESASDLSPTSGSTFSSRKVGKQAVRENVPQRDQFRTLIERLANFGMPSKKLRDALEDLCNDDAQSIVDFLDEALESNDLSLEGRSRFLRLFTKIIKSTRVYPGSFALTDVVCDFSRKPKYNGGFGDVYIGELRGFPVCVKTLRLNTNDEQKKSLRLRAYAGEFALWSHLSHPNVLPFYGVHVIEQESQTIGIVSPWMEAGNLSEYLKTNPSSPRVPLLTDMASGDRFPFCAFYESLRRRAQQCNVLVSDNRRALLADFGLSTIATGGIKDTTAANHAGTWHWMAPERLTAEEMPPPTKESDMWAFACTCHEAI